MMNRVIGCVAAILCGAGCSTSPREQAPAEVEAPPTGELTEPIRVTVVQRTSTAVRLAGATVRLQIGDVTAGQVLVKVLDRGSPLIDLTSVEPGDVLSFTFRSTRFYLKLVRLKNVLIGDDFAVFEITTSPPPAPQRAPPKTDPSRPEPIVT